MAQIDFLSGMIAAGYAACSLVLLRLWMRGGDGFVRSLALTLTMLGVAQAFVTFAGSANDNQGYVYLLRAAAFCILIIDILRKNLAR